MYVELSTGHCFVPDSVKGITPLHREHYSATFNVVGIGYVVEIYLPLYNDSTLSGADKLKYFKTEMERLAAIRQEFVDKLLGNKQT